MNGRWKWISILLGALAGAAAGWLLLQLVEFGIRIKLPEDELRWWHYLEHLGIGAIVGALFGWLFPDWFQRQVSRLKHLTRWRRRRS